MLQIVWAIFLTSLSVNGVTLLSLENKFLEPSRIELFASTLKKFGKYT